MRTLSSAGVQPPSVACTDCCAVFRTLRTKRMYCAPISTSLGHSRRTWEKPTPTGQIMCSKKGAQRT
eukprot:2698402-Lingulodinium_polyedra.AAC.1